MDISKFRSPKNYEDESNWAEWLEEDILPETSTQPIAKAKKGILDGYGATERSHAQKRRTRHVRRSGASESIAINISMPRISRATLKQVWRRMWPWLAGSLLVVGALYGGRLLISYLSERGKSAQTLTPAETRAAIAFGYKPLVPDTANRTVGEALPSTPVFLDEKSYTFTDTYKGVNITVDQQALPDSFRDNDTQILRIAEDINATDEFTTTLGTVYMYTSPTSGAQRLVLANDKMLMFLQSTTSLEVAEWVSYIQSLR